MKYFILDSTGKPKQVSETEYLTWKSEYATYFNRHFKRADGTKELRLEFVGLKEPRRSLVLFTLRSIFRTPDGCPVNDHTFEFKSYKDAVAHFDDELEINGDKMF
jgi:hypothetical protein